MIPTRLPAQPLTICIELHADAWITAESRLREGLCETTGDSSCSPGLAWRLPFRPHPTKLMHASGLAMATGAARRLVSVTAIKSECRRLAMQHA
jgi:hypothetical protein